MHTHIYNDEPNVLFYRINIILDYNKSVTLFTNYVYKLKI